MELKLLSVEISEFSEFSDIYIYIYIYIFSYVFREILAEISKQSG